MIDCSKKMGFHSATPHCHGDILAKTKDRSRTLIILLLSDRTSWQYLLTIAHEFHKQWILHDINSRTGQPGRHCPSFRAWGRVISMLKTPELVKSLIALWVRHFSRKVTKIPFAMWAAVKYRQSKYLQHSFYREPYRDSLFRHRDRLSCQEKLRIDRFFR